LHTSFLTLSLHDALPICDFIVWCNNTHTRMGQTCDYITLNIGLACNDRARFIAYTVIDEFEKAGDTVYKPNIVFKVSDGVNRKEDRKSTRLNSSHVSISY